MTDLLVGVGVGPGDPELVTLKAVRILREAGTILVPAIDDVPPGRGRRDGSAAPGQGRPDENAAPGRWRPDENAAPGQGRPAENAAPGRAEAIVLAHVGEEGRRRVRRVGFAMREPVGTTPARLAAWEAAAATVLAAFEAGAGPVAFATIGDPSVYSTFSYVAQAVRARRPDVTVELVPGIMAMQDLAARAAVPLCEGAETLTLVPATAGLDALRAALRTGDTVVAYKAGRHLPDLLTVLAAEDRLADAVVGCGLGLPGERIVPADRLDPTVSAPYLTTVLAGRAGRRPAPGGAS